MPRPVQAATEARAWRRPAFLAILMLTLGWALVMQASGWAQTSNYALVRALARGTATIDDYHWETRDKTYLDGHFYSVKAPGLAFLTLPLYELLDAVDAPRASRWAARRADEGGAGRWVQGGPPRGNYGNSKARATEVRKTIDEETPVVWALGLLGVIAPALVLLLLVRALAERIQPGYGTAAAVTLGVCTLVMPFATLFFSHVLAAMLGFAAFALLWHEREGPPRLALVAAAGLLAGLSVTTEYPLALAGAIVGLYALSRGDVIRRGLSYAGGVVVGLLPLFVYNLWAFGSISHFSYENAVRLQGVTGHAVLGLNDQGFFGITNPSPIYALGLLFSGRGLLILSPVLVAGIAGTVLLYRAGKRAEALTVGAVSLAYLAYNAGYYLPFGGGSPGPRFLIPILPFLALGLAIAYRRFPATTLALAVPSAVLMVAGTITLPLIGNGDIGAWTHLLDAGIFEHTVVSSLGGDNSWPAIAPVFAALALAVAFATRATGSQELAREGALPFAAIACWALVAALAPVLFGQDSAGANNRQALILILIAATVSVVTLTAALLVEQRPWERRLLAGRGGAQRGVTS
jgi:hypothetical protein